MQIKPLLSVAIAALSLSAVPLGAVPITFEASLSGPAESPPNASPGTGFAQVTIDSAAHTLRVVVTFADLTSDNSAAHIHVINGPGDANTADTLGPVATTTPTFPGFPIGTSGSYDQTFDTTLATTYRAGWITSSGSLAAAEAALFSGIMDGRAYLNIHTINFQAGEIRGFLQLADVPEPATGMLMLAGVLLMAGVLRGRNLQRPTQVG